MYWAIYHGFFVGSFSDIINGSMLLHSVGMNDIDIVSVKIFHSIDSLIILDMGAAMNVASKCRAPCDEKCAGEPRSCNLECYEEKGCSLAFGKRNLY